MHWYVADKEYIAYLNKFDAKVQKIDYGNSRLKPYIGIVLRRDDICYYIPISSAKNKHKTMKNGKDFLKIVDKNNTLLSVLNINNMIPIPDDCIKKLNYACIEDYRNFKTDSEKEKYINFLIKELNILNDMSEKIIEKSDWLYKHYIDFPNDKISSRCCDFKLLEEKCKEYVKEESIEDDLELEL